MKKVNCIFCNENKEKAKEHIWPKWLQIEIGGNTQGQFTGTHLNMQNPKNSDTRTHFGETLVTGNVCKECNNGWMNALELECKPIIRELIKNKIKVLELNKIEIKTISLWAFKTALIINAGSNYRKLIPKSHYDYIYKHKSIIKNVKIDLGFIKSKEELLWKQSSFEYVNLRSNSNINYIYTIKDSYKISMQIKLLGIRVSFFPTAKENGYQLNFSQNNKNIGIWPYTKNQNFDINSEYNNIHEFDFDLVVSPII